MHDNDSTNLDRETSLDNLAAELATAAYPVALAHGTGGSWVDLELDLWKVLSETIKKRARKRLLPATQGK